MKKITITLGFLFFAFIAFGQIPNVTKISNVNTRYQIYWPQSLNGFIMTPQDTLGNKSKPYFGALTIRPQDTTLYMSVIKYWIPLGSINGSGGINGIKLNSDSTKYIITKTGTPVDSVSSGFTKVSFTGCIVGRVINGVLTVTDTCSHSGGGGGSGITKLGVPDFGLVKKNDSTYNADSAQLATLQHVRSDSATLAAATAVNSASIATKKNIFDSSIAQASNYVTQFQRKKEADSLAVLIAAKGNGTVTNVGSLTGLFTTTNQTTTPTFALNSQTGKTVFGASTTGTPSFLTLDSSFFAGSHTQTYYDGRYQPIGTIAGLISQGTNTTITGSGTTASPYVINATASGGADSAIWKNNGTYTANRILTMGNFTQTFTGNKLIVDSLHIKPVAVATDSILFYGPSTTAGTTGPSYRSLNWTTKVAQRIGALEANYGINGAPVTTTLLTAVSGLPYNLNRYRWVFLDIGGINDLWPGTADSTTFSNAQKKIIDSVIINHGGTTARTILMTGFTTLGPGGTAVRNEQYRKATIANGITKSLKVMDVDSALQANGGAGLLLSDQLHWNDFTQQIITNMALQITGDTVRSKGQAIAVNFAPIEATNIIYKGTDSIGGMNAQIAVFDSSGKMHTEARTDFINNSTITRSIRQAGGPNTWNSYADTSVIGFLRVTKSVPTGQTNASLFVAYDSTNNIGYLNAFKPTGSVQGALVLNAQANAGNVVIGSGATNGVDLLTVGSTSSGIKSGYGRFNGTPGTAGTGSNLELGFSGGQGAIWSANRTAGTFIPTNIGNVGLPANTTILTVGSTTVSTTATAQINGAFGLYLAGQLSIKNTSPNIAASVDMGGSNKGFLGARGTRVNRDSINLTVGSVTVTNGGTGYTSNSTKTYTTAPADGITAIGGTDTRTGNVITAIGVPTPIGSYNATPAIVISGGGGTGATAVANMVQVLPTGLEYYCTDCIAPDGTTGVQQQWNGTKWVSISQPSNTARYSATGNGTTTITIPHGLTGVTSSSIISVTPKNAASAGISYVTTDATNITLTYGVGPANAASLSYDIILKP